MSLDRNNSDDTLNKSLDIKCKLNIEDNFEDDDKSHNILLTCQINAYAEPPIISMEQIPIDASAGGNKRHATDHELYFLQWVFNGLFIQLNQLIDTKYKGYKILHPEIEPGISWQDFRSGRRSLLLWLLRSEPKANSDTSLRFLSKGKSNLQNSSEPQPLWDKCGLLPKAIFNELQDLKQQMQLHKEEMSRTEAKIENILQIIKESCSSPQEHPFTAIDQPIHGSSGHDGGEWSVVENAEDSDPEDNVTSASISGYEDYDDSDI